MNLSKVTTIELNIQAKRLAWWVKISADDILKYFILIFRKKKRFWHFIQIVSFWEIIFINYQILFSWKNEKNIINLSSADLVQIVGKVNLLLLRQY